MLRFVVLLSALVALAAAPQAGAQSCEAPPGTAAVDEYCETIPGAGGDRGTADDSKPAVPVPGATARQLAQSGKDGAALLRELGQDGAKPRTTGNGRDQARAGDTAPAAPSDNPLDAVGSALSSGPTLGAGFIAALLGVTLLMLTWGWIAYRRRTGD